MKEFIGFIGGGAIIQLLIAFIGQWISLRSRSEDNRWKLFELQLLAVSEYAGLAKQYLEQAKIIMYTIYELNEANRNLNNGIRRDKDNIIALEEKINRLKSKNQIMSDELNDIFLKLQTQLYYVTLLFQGIELSDKIMAEVNKVSNMLVDISKDINNGNVPDTERDKNQRVYLKNNYEQSIVEMLNVTSTELNKISPNFTKNNLPIRYKWIIFVITLVIFALFIGISYKILSK